MGQHLLPEAAASIRPQHLWIIQPPVWLLGLETPSLAPGFPGRCSVVPCNGWQTQLILGLFPTPLFQNLCQEAPRLCPHLNQRLKSHNPPNDSRPALHTHCCLEGHQKPTAASVPLPRRPHQTCSTTSPCQAAGGAGHAWHLIFLRMRIGIQLY